MFGKRMTQYQAGTRILCPSSAHGLQNGIYKDWGGRHAVVVGSRMYDDGDPHPVQRDARASARRMDAYPLYSEDLYLRPCYVLAMQDSESLEFAQIDEVHLLWPPNGNGDASDAYDASDADKRPAQAQTEISEKCIIGIKRRGNDKAKKFKMLVDNPMHKVMDAYTSSTKIDSSKVRFMFHGLTISRHVL